MGINTTLESASTTAASNGPSGSDQRTIADDALRQYLAFIKSLKTLATLASNTTVTPPSTANAFSVTGTTAITTIASTNSWDGRDILFIFAGILTFTHGSNLILPGSANITTAVGDAAWLVQVASGQWRCVGYSRADGSWAYGNITASAFIPSGATVPTNGLYLKAANNPALASNSTLRWDVNSTGNHVFAAPSAGAALTVGAFAGSHAILASSSLNGSIVSIGANNTSNTASSDARLVTSVGGSSAGDPYVVFDISGVTDWAVGLDNSDSDKFKISASSNLGTADVVSITSIGNVTVNAPTSGSHTINNIDAIIHNTTSASGYIRTQESSTDRGYMGYGTALFSGGSNTDYGIVAAASCTLRLGSGSAAYIKLDTDGRLSGTALHNNAGAVTGTTNQYIASGTYTPTITDSTNVTGHSAGVFTWTRTGNVVNVAGSTSITTTAGSVSLFRVSLPIASNLASIGQLAGSGGHGGAVAIPIVAYEEISTDQAECMFVPPSGGTRQAYVTFQYVIV